MDIFQRILDILKGINKGKAIRIAILAVLIIAVATTATILLNRTAYSVLYSGMDASDAGEILTILDELNVSAKAQGEDTILVDSSQVASVRMQLASQGYPKSKLNYDIFNSSSVLGSTDLDRQINLQFQMEVNLSESIKWMAKIKDALVILNMEESDNFVWSTDSKPASASVVIDLEQGQRIDNDEVRAITVLVSKSISGLLEENVSIVDTQMVLYSIDNDDFARNVGTQLEVQNEVRSQYQKQILKLLDPIFGAGNVKAEVNVVLNFDKKVIESVEYTSPTDSSEGIRRSYQNLYEIVKNADETGGVVGMDANGSMTQYISGAEIDENAEYQKITEQANMEINHTKTMIENAQGAVEDLSVAIVLNSTNNINDFTDSVQALIAKTIGTDEENITVMMMPFVQSEKLDIESAFANRTEVLSDAQRAETTRILIIIGACFIGLILLIAIIRALTSSSSYEDYEEYDEYIPTVGKQAVTAGGLGGGVDIVADEEIVPPVPDLKFESGNPSLVQLGKYINSNPESVAMLLKKWLHED